MKKFFILLISIVALQSLLSAAGTVITDSFYSDALDMTRYMRIYLPAGYDTSGLDYPVIYFFHGGGSNHMSYANIYYHLDTLIDNGHIAPVIMVKPDASIGPYYGSAYTNSALYGDFEDYLVYDLIEYIESSYRVISSRDKRSVMGHSMGGAGALKIGFLHPDIYCAAADHSGLVDYSVMLQYHIPMILAENGGVPPYNYNPNAGTFTGVAFTYSGAFSPDTTDPPYCVDFILDSLGTIVDSVYDLWRLHDTPYLAAQLPLDTIAIYMDCGTSDEYYCYQTHTALVESLDVLGHEYHWCPYAGSHSNQLNIRFPIALVFLDSVMTTGIEEGGPIVPVRESVIGATVFRGPLILPVGIDCYIYDITGCKITTRNPAPGIYFIKSDSSMIRKVIKIN